MKELELENQRLRKAIADLTLDKLILAEVAGATFSPRAPTRLCRAHQAEVGCIRTPRLSRPRSAPLDASRKVSRGRDDEEALTADIIALAREYGRYGYRKVTALLRAAGWAVNAKRVERIWRREGLKVPARQPKKGRLWLNDGASRPAQAGVPQPGLHLMTSWRTGRITGASSACSTSWTSLPTSAYRSGWLACSRPRT